MPPFVANTEGEFLKCLFTSTTANADNIRRKKSISGENTNLIHFKNHLTNLEFYRKLLLAFSCISHLMFLLIIRYCGSLGISGVWGDRIGLFFSYTEFMENK